MSSALPRCPKCEMKLLSDPDIQALHIENCDGDPVTSDQFADGRCPMCGQRFGYFSKHIRNCPAALR